ncbi:MAG: hypothetical protein K2O00_05285 [Muribaculaceae bacterium]|nr:hypothetical protein [Muribaculaceae bacterium]
MIKSIDFVHAEVYSYDSIQCVASNQNSLVILSDKLDLFKSPWFGSLSAFPNYKKPYILKNLDEWNIFVTELEPDRYNALYIHKKDTLFTTSFENRNIKFESLSLNNFGTEFNDFIKVGMPYKSILKYSFLIPQLSKAQIDFWDNKIRGIDIICVDQSSIEQYQNKYKLKIIPLKLNNPNNIDVDIIRMEVNDVGNVVAIKAGTVKYPLYDIWKLW